MSTPGDIPRLTGPEVGDRVQVRLMGVIVEMDTNERGAEIARVMLEREQLDTSDGEVSIWEDSERVTIWKDPIVPTD